MSIGGKNVGFGVSVVLCNHRRGGRLRELEHTSSEIREDYCNDFSLEQVGRCLKGNAQDTWI